MSSLIMKWFLQPRLCYDESVETGFSYLPTGPLNSYPLRERPDLDSNQECLATYNDAPCRVVPIPFEKQNATHRLSFIQRGLILG